MSQVILYLICELSRKLKQLMLGNERVSKRKDIKSIVAGYEATDAAPAYTSTNKREAFVRSRLPTLVNVNGFGQCIAVLTSGGDAQARKIKSNEWITSRFAFENRTLIVMREDFEFLKFKFNIYFLVSGFMLIDHPKMSFLRTTSIFFFSNFSAKETLFGLNDRLFF